MICIEEYEKTDSKNILRILKEKTSYIIREEKEDFIILKIKDKKRTIKKLDKFLKTTKETISILEKKFENSKIEKVLIENNIEIIEGRKLFVELLNESILNYICRNQKRKINTLNVVVMTNEDILRNIKMIENLSKRVKELIVYTKRIEKFKKIENLLYEKYGININITNNSKLIEKSEIYINLDLIEDEIQKLKLNRNGIFINTYYKFTYDNKQFNGINIIDYEIKFPLENSNIKEILSKYDNKKIVEYYFLYKNNLKNKKIKINYLIGKNGKLMSREFYRK